MSGRTAPQSRGPLWLWSAPSLLLLAGMLVWGVLRYPDLPDRIPQHIGPDGVDAWTDKSALAAFVPILVYAGVTVMTVGSVALTVRITPLDEMPEPAGRFASSSLVNRPATAASARGTAKAILLMNSVIGVALLPLCWLQWRTTPDAAVPGWILPVTLVLLALGLVPLIIAWRQDSAAKKALGKRTSAA